MGKVISTVLSLFRRRAGFQWGGGEIIVVAILIFGILSMGSGMFGKWIRSSRGGGLLMVDLHSLSSANYGVDEMPVSVPAIGLEIIQDLLGVNPPPVSDSPGGIALVTPTSATPTPTLPQVGTQPPTPTPVVLPSDSTPTSEAKDTATPAPGRTPTPTSQPPAGTHPPQGPGQTQPPTPTARISPTPVPATNTPQPSMPPSTSPPQPSPIPPTSEPPTSEPPTSEPPTSVPQPSPTPQPAASPTPRPTRSSTLAVSPTAGYTPVVSPDPPVLP